MRRLHITKRPLTPSIQRRKYRHHLPRRRTSGRRTCSRRRVSAGRRTFLGSNRHSKRQRALALARAHGLSLRDPSTWTLLPNLMAEEIPPTTTVRILLLRQIFHRRRRTRSQRRGSILIS